MKKVLKVVGIIVFIIVLLNVSIFFTARYGWRLFGFDKCYDPDGLFIDTVYVTDETVYIRGNVSNSASCYVGHTYKYENDVLYIGIKQNIVTGFTDRIGAYHFKIEDDFTNIKSIYITNNQKNKCIWSMDTDQKDDKYMEKIQKVRLYETISITNDMNIEEEIKNAEFIYADDDLLDRIRHPKFSGELYFTKGGSYLGVAELKNGEEIYLAFDRHYNSYYVIGKFGHYEY